MKVEKSYPSIGQAIILAFMLIVLQIVFGIVMAIASLIAGLKVPAGDPFLIGIVNLVAFAIIVLWVLRRGKRTFRDLIALLPFRLVILVPLISLLFGLGIVASEADNILRYCFPLPEFLASLYQDLRSGGIASLITLAVVAPLTEEFLFRGVFLRSFLARYSAIKAILCSAILFSLFHLSPYQYFSGFITGIVFGWLFLRTRSLWPCIIAHALYNSQDFIVAALLPIEIPGYTSSTATLAKLQFQPMWFNITGLVLLGLGILGLARTLSFGGTKAEQANPADS